MRIVESDFHDYYDSCMSHGMDKSLIYRRKTEAISDPPAKYRHCYPERCDWYGGDAKIFTTVGWIGFCGAFYPYLRFHVSRPAGQADTVIYAYSQSDLDNFYSEHIPDLDVSTWHGKTTKFMRQTGKNWRREKKHHENHLANLIRTDEPFFDYGVPIIHPRTNTEWVGGGFVIDLNVCLKDLQFYKLFDAYSAFQEISMYLGGVLPQTGKKTVELSDVSKRDKHGFDSMSFKTRSPGKKRKQRK